MSETVVKAKDCQIDLDPETGNWHVIWNQQTSLYQTGSITEAVSFMTAVEKDYLPVSVRAVPPDPEIIT